MLFVCLFFILILYGSFFHGLSVGGVKYLLPALPCFSLSFIYGVHVVLFLFVVYVGCLHGPFILFLFVYAGCMGGPFIPALVCVGCMGTHLCSLRGPARFMVPGLGWPRMVIAGIPCSDIVIGIHCQDPCGPGLIPR
jgi:hypothetical protein